MSLYFILALSENLEQTEESANILSQFLLVLVLGLGLGFCFLLFVLPRLGDIIGNFFFLPNHKAPLENSTLQEIEDLIEEENHHDALALCLKTAAEKNPETLLSSIKSAAKICTAHLNDPQSGIDILDQWTQEKKLSIEERGKLRFRIAEIYLTELKDKKQARQQWQTITEEQPEGRQHANAQHLLREHS